jgi:hypothetical protein
MEEWARSKNMHPIDEEGNVDIVGAVNGLVTLVRGKSSDEEVDALLQAWKVIGNMRAADGHMNDARDLWAGGKRDEAAEEMDKAIELRPDDWSYRLDRARLALESGDTDGFNDQMAEAHRGRGVTGADEVDFLNGAIDDLEDTEDSSFKDGYESGDQCRALYDGLSDLYNRRANANNSDSDRAMAQGYANQATYCKP